MSGCFLSALWDESIRYSWKSSRVFGIFYRDPTARRWFDCSFKGEQRRGLKFKGKIISHSFTPFNSSTSSFWFLPFAFTTSPHYLVLFSCSFNFHINLSLHIWLQVFPASGEVPCGGALPPKVIPGPSPLLHTLIRCLIKVDNIV